MCSYMHGCVYVHVNALVLLMISFLEILKRSEKKNQSKVPHLIFFFFVVVKERRNKSVHSEAGFYYYNIIIFKL